MTIDFDEEDELQLDEELLSDKEDELQELTAEYLAAETEQRRWSNDCRQSCNTSKRRWRCWCWSAHR